MKRFTFSLRMLVFGLPLILGIILAVSATSIREAQRVRTSNVNERENARVISQHDGNVTWIRVRTTWLVHLLSGEAHEEVVNQIGFSPHVSPYFTDVPHRMFPRSPALSHAICRLSGPGLRLNVRGTDFNSHDLMALSESSLQVIEAAGTVLKDDELADFDVPPTLTEFEASNTKVGDRLLCQIAKGNVKTLRLSGTTVTDEGIRCLTRHATTLVDADFNKTAISSEGVRLLCGITSLRRLYTPTVTDPIVAELQRKRFSTRQ